MIKTAVLGLGKMGLSHLAIARAHPDIDLVAGCDSNSYLTDVLAQYSGLKCYGDFDRLLAEEKLDALLVATPSKFHAAMVEKALERGLHVFCEKPFVLDPEDGYRLAELAEQKKLVNQVGYHYRFVGAFQEAARIVRSGALGEVHHVRIEAYGPVVLRPSGSTWRSTKTEGGGALYDYACHALDLMNFVAGTPGGVNGVVRHSVFSRDVDDEVYALFRYPGGASAQLSVNWSDESHRKMSTAITVWGSRGRLSADRQECQIYLREPHEALPGAPKGWSVRYTTDLTQEVWYYLRGEEYSAQVDYFVQSIKLGRTNGENSFRSALQTDRLVAMLLETESSPGQQRAIETAPIPGRRAGLWSRLIGERT